MATWKNYTICVQRHRGGGWERKSRTEPMTLDDAVHLAECVQRDSHGKYYAVGVMDDPIRFAFVDCQYLAAAYA